MKTATKILLTATLIGLFCACSKTENDAIGTKSNTDNGSPSIGITFDTALGTDTITL